MSLPPVEIPLGAMRFNSDSQKLEYFNGEIWLQVHTFNPDLNGGVRAVSNVGNFTPAINTLNYINISSQGNALDFGDSTEARVGGSCPSSKTRGLFGGGNGGAPAYPSSLTIDYITFSTTSNAIDFGDLTDGADYARSCISSGTRGLFGGGWPADSDVIDYVTIASLGNAVDFGNLNENMGGGPTGASSPTRGVFVGGYHPSPSPLVTRDTLQYVTIATIGNTQDFGNLSTARAHSGTSSSATRIVAAAGYTGGGPSTPHLKSVEFITISTLGNGTNFGELSATRFAAGSASDCIRSVFIGGTTGSVINTIESISISTGGDAVDFGDLTAAGAWIGANSNGHGGLG